MFQDATISVSYCQQVWLTPLELRAKLWQHKTQAPVLSLHCPTVLVETLDNKALSFTFVKNELWHCCVDANEWPISGIELQPSCAREANPLPRCSLFTGTCCPVWRLCKLAEQWKLIFPTRILSCSWEQLLNSPVEVFHKSRIVYLCCVRLGINFNCGCGECPTLTITMPLKTSSNLSKKDNNSGFVDYL